MKEKARGEPPVDSRTPEEKAEALKLAFGTMEQGLSMLRQLVVLLGAAATPESPMGRVAETAKYAESEYQRRKTAEAMGIPTVPWESKGDA